MRFGMQAFAHGSQADWGGPDQQPAESPRAPHWIAGKLSSVGSFLSLLLAPSPSRLSKLSDLDGQKLRRH